MATLGEMFLMAVMGALSLVLGPHWAVSEPEAKSWGQAFEAWLKAQPAKRRKALTNALAAVPTLNLVVATGMIVAPRVQATLEIAKRAKEVRDERKAGTDGDSAGSGGANQSPHGNNYASLIAKTLGGDVRGEGEGSGPGDSGVFPQA